MKQLEKRLVLLYRALLNNEFKIKQLGKSVHPEFKLSAMNLARYITLRSLDLRQVHDHLSELGISALRSCEGYVWSNLTSALKLVKLLNGSTWEANSDLEFIGYKKSKKLLKRHTSNLFGVKKRIQSTKIMVTLPLEAASDIALLVKLLNEGMTVARIDMNLGNEEIWKAMIHNLHTASQALDRQCKVYMDLSGPQITTGKIKVLKGGGKKKKVNYLKLRHGEHLILNGDTLQSSSLLKGKRGELLKYPCVGISNPSVLKDVKIGDRILFDDGRIESEVLKKRKGEVEVLIKNTPEKGIKLKGKKRINLPDSKLSLHSLTASDVRKIPFVVENADMIGYPFVRNENDVRELNELIKNYKGNELGIIIKIENRDGFENLPLILLEAMKFPRVGVLISRGDLAIEMGADRIAEVQDQIMWICEAAHIPVIWATDVLENLTKTGLATRAEITDAAKSARAECVLLNQGPHIGEAVRTLRGILKKMESHMSKKKSVLRALNVAKMNVDRIGVKPQLEAVDKPHNLI